MQVASISALLIGLSLAAGVLPVQSLFHSHHDAVRHVAGGPSPDAEGELDWEAFLDDAGHDRIYEASIKEDTVRKGHQRLEKPRPPHFEVTSRGYKVIDELEASKASYSKGNSSLSNEVIIVTFGRLPHQYIEERIALLESVYAPHGIGKLFFLGNGPGFEKDLDPWGQQEGRIAARESCDVWMSTWLPYKCVAALIDTMQETGEDQKFSGLTYMHFDFWLHPAFYAQRLQQSPDALLGVLGGFESQGPTYHCVKSSEFDQIPWVHRPHGFGHVDVPGTIERVREMDRATFGRRDQDPVMCHGWADMYRLPRKAWPTFSRMAHSFDGLRKAGSGFHEIILPTMLTRLAKTLEGKEEEEVLPFQCWGGPCEKTADPWYVAKFPCGHKMDLSLAEMRAGLVESFARG